MGSAALIGVWFTLANVASCAHTAQTSAEDSITNLAVTSPNDDPCNIRNFQDQKIQWHAEGIGRLFSISGTAVTRAAELETHKSDAGVGVATDKAFRLSAGDVKVFGWIGLPDNQQFVVHKPFRCSLATLDTLD